eukprot:scaffold121477_cov75-Phaeocystis_antarctica.AAC.1
MQHANQVACDLPVNITSSVRHSGFSPSGSVTASPFFSSVCGQSKEQSSVFTDSSGAIENE